MARIRVLLAIFPGVLVVLGCNGEAGSYRLQGEWLVSFQVQDSELAAISDYDGVFVFDSRLPCYCDEEVQPTPGAIAGRGYLDYQVLGSPMKSASAQHFLHGRGADMTEEFEGSVERGGQLRIWGVGTPVMMWGEMEAHSALGRWVFISRGDTLGEGSFLMRRRAPTEYSDSARIRSRREVRSWRSTTLPPEPSDTVRISEP